MGRKLFGGPQSSISGPLLFSIYVCDLFWILSNTDFASFADDNTPYIVKDDIKEVFQWLSNNQMKTNPDNCCLVTSKRED